MVEQWPVCCCRDRRASRAKAAGSSWKKSKKLSDVRIDIGHTSAASVPQKFQQVRPSAYYVYHPRGCHPPPEEEDRGQEEVPTGEVPQAEIKEVVCSAIHPRRTESLKKALCKARAAYYSTLIKDLLSSPTDLLTSSSTSLL